VILHISYTAKDDGRLKEDVESALVERLNQLATEEGLSRSFSLKREFASALHQLQHPALGTSPEVEIRLDRRYFPYFLHNQAIEIGRATLILQPKEVATFDVSKIKLLLNDDAGDQWIPFPDVTGQLMANSFEINESLDPEGNTWTIKLNQGNISQLEDVWLVVAFAFRIE